MVNLMASNPDGGDVVDFTMTSIDPMTANIDAMLAVTFARNMKMMKFINKIYDADKDYYASIAKKNSRFKSRIITDNRITIKLNAIKALAIITAAKDDEKLREDLHAQVEKAYKKEAQFFAEYESAITVPMEMFLVSVRKKFEGGNSSDYLMTEIMCLYLYFCRHYGKPIKIKDENEQLMYEDAFGHELAAMMTVKEYFQEIFVKSNLEDHRKEFADIMPKVTAFSKSLSEFFYNINISNPELLGLFQTWWDIAALDNLPISMYEQEEMSRSDMEDIFNIILLHMIKEEMPGDQMMIAILGAMIMRSFARVYHEAVDTIEQYAGVIETSERDKKLVEDAKKLRQKVESQETLIADKQEKLNAQQLEVDRLRKALREKDLELAQLQEQNQLLRQFIQDEGKDDKPIAEEPISVEDALKAKVVVIGGTTGWQSAVKERAERYVCIDVKDNAFDTRIINSADPVVFKIDYLPHTQFYRVIDKIRKMKLPVVYCSNNIDLMLKKIARELSKRR